MNLLYCRSPLQAVHRESEPEDHLLIRIVIMPSVVYGCCHMPYPLQGIYNILTVHLFWKKERFSQDPDLPADHVCSYFWSLHWRYYLCIPRHLYMLLLHAQSSFWIMSSCGLIPAYHFGWSLYLFYSSKWFHPLQKHFFYSQYIILLSQFPWLRTYSTNFSFQNACSFLSNMLFLTLLKYLSWSVTIYYHLFWV